MQLTILQITAWMGRKMTNARFSYGPDLAVKVFRSVKRGRTVKLVSDCSKALPRTNWGQLNFGWTRIRQYNCEIGADGRLTERLPRLRVPKSLRPVYSKQRRTAILGACHKVNRILRSNKRKYRLPCRGIWWTRGGSLASGKPPVLIFNYGKCSARRPNTLRQVILYHRAILDSGLQIGLLDARRCGKSKKPVRETGLWLNRDYRKQRR